METLVFEKALSTIKTLATLNITLTIVILGVVIYNKITNKANDIV